MTEGVRVSPVLGQRIGAGNCWFLPWDVMRRVDMGTHVSFVKIELLNVSRKVNFIKVGHSRQEPPKDDGHRKCGQWSLTNFLNFVSTPYMQICVIFVTSHTMPTVSS